MKLTLQVNFGESSEELDKVRSAYCAVNTNLISQLVGVQHHVAVWKVIQEDVSSHPPKTPQDSDKTSELFEKVN